MALGVDTHSAFGWDGGSGGSRMKLSNEIFNEVVFAPEVTAIVVPEHPRNQESHV